MRPLDEELSTRFFAHSLNHQFSIST